MNSLTLWKVRGLVDHVSTCPCALPHLQLNYISDGMYVFVGKNAEEGDKDKESVDHGKEKGRSHEEGKSRVHSHSIASEVFCTMKSCCSHLEVETECTRSECLLEVSSKLGRSCFSVVCCTECSRHLALK